MKPKRIAVIAAHPDDEALGCAGTLFKHRAAGDQLFFLFLTDGISSRGENSDLNTRAGGLTKAMKMIGAKEFRALDLPDNALDSVPLLNIIQPIEKFIAEFKIEVIYTHWLHDLNIDHALTARAVLTAARPLPNSTVKVIRSFEVLSSSEWSPEQVFCPNYFSNIQKHSAEKEKYLKCYADEMRLFPHPRSFEAVRALSLLRGVSAGVLAAEAFITLREIV